MAVSTSLEADVSFCTSPEPLKLLTWLCRLCRALLILEMALVMAAASRSIRSARFTAGVPRAETAAPKAVRVRKNFIVEGN